MAKNILVIDSNFKNYQQIQASLQDESTNLHYAATIQDGLKELMRYKFCLIIMDFFISVGCEQTLIGAISTKSPMTMIVLSGRFSNEVNVLTRLAGLYDFLSKQYEMNHITQRSYAFGGSEGMIIDTERRLVLVRGNEVELTRKEYEILIYLYENRNIVLTYTQIYLAVWNEDYLGDSDAISFHICQLRKKLCNGFIIQSVRGVGYCLKLIVS